MSVSDGRTSRLIPPKKMAFRQLQFVEKKINRQKKVKIQTNNKIVMSFFMIVLGGTLLTIATIYDNRPIWWSGVVVLIITIVAIIVQSSLNNPCSAQ